MPRAGSKISVGAAGRLPERIVNERVRNAGNTAADLPELAEKRRNLRDVFARRQRSDQRELYLWIAGQNGK